MSKSKNLNMRNITIRVPAEDIEGLDEIAVREERDRSWIVRKIIREHLKETLRQHGLS